MGLVISRMPWRSVFYLCILACWSCNSITHEKDTAYSFVVAGHVYGNPVDYEPGMHPPFRTALKQHAAENSIEFAVLTGDVVPRGTKDFWNAVVSYFLELNLPFHIAAGNHDMTDTDLFEAYTGSLYESFRKNNDLFILANANLDNWNIKGEQYDFIKRTLLQTPEVERIFFFSHQVIWWEPENRFSAIHPNWTEGRGSTVNFWQEVFPLFENRDCPVYFFAGDVGAVPKSKNLYYAQDGNFTFIASGMGNGKEDHFLVAHVSAGELHFEIVSLDPDQDLGMIEAYTTD